MNSNNRNENLEDDRKSYFFHGKFVPERTNIQLNYMGHGAKLSDRSVKFDLFAFGSEFNGKISSDVPFENMLAVHSVVYLLVRSILDRLSYINICGYDFDLIGAVSVSSQAHQVFGVYEPVYFDDLAQQQESAKEKIPFSDELVGLKFHDVRLDHALRCFCHAMRDDALTPLFCYLAIETLVRRVVEIVRDREIEDVRAAEWVTFRERLNIEETTIKDDIKVLADSFRHGKFVNVSWDARKKMLSLTWEIIRRSMYFMRTKAALETSSFPEI